MYKKSTILIAPKGQEYKLLNIMIEYQKYKGKKFNKEKHLYNFCLNELT